MNENNIDSMKVLNKEELSHYYLKKHQIVELFNNLTAALVYQRPGMFFLAYFINIGAHV